MKPFDLEAAKNGAPVCTRDGRNARIICFDRNNTDYRIVALIGDSDSCTTYTERGLMYSHTHSNQDLMMVEPEPAVLPYNSAEEVMEAIKKHGSWVKNKYAEEYFNIGCVCDGFILMTTAKDSVSAEDFAEALENNVWADDGTPFGVEE